MSMRKLILLAAVAAIAFPSAAMAERHHDRNRDRDRHEVHRDKREVRQDRRELRRDRRQGDVREVHRDRREVRGDRRELRQDRREVRSDRRDYRNYRDNRYDRRDYRDNRYDRHRTRVRYVAPYRSWSYRPVSIGFRLDPIFYSSRYYINDYGYYHLRIPRPWERWIRYGDDLLLVNLRNGRVVDVIHYRYW
jgi:Ni/Co efflux regulator RcnB